MKKNIIKITSLNLAILTALSVGGIIIKNKKHKTNNLTTSTIEFFDDKTTTTSSVEESTINVNDKIFTVENTTSPNLDEKNEENLREKFYDILDQKNFDEQTKEALIYIYDAIDENYDSYKESNSFLKLPSKYEYIQSNILDCLENNVEKIKLGSYTDPEIVNKLGNANGCYYYNSKEVYVKINSESTTEAIAKILCHEILGHANQNKSVTMFGDVDDIIIEGGATWRLETLSQDYCYQNKHTLYTMNGHSLDTYGPDVAYKNNLYYKLFGTLLILTDYQTMLAAYNSKSIDGVIEKLNENTNNQGEYILNLMANILKTMDDFDSNSITAENITTLDNIVLDIFEEKGKNVSTPYESKQLLDAFQKYSQQYLSRDFAYTDDGEKIDVTEQTNIKYIECKNAIIKQSLKNSAIEAYSEDDYRSLLVLRTKESVKTETQKIESKDKTM